MHAGPLRVRSSALIIGVSGLVLVVILSVLVWIILSIVPSAISVRLGVLVTLVCLVSWTLTLWAVMQPALLVSRQVDRNVKTFSVSRQTIRRALLVWSMLGVATIVSIFHVQLYLRESLPPEARTAFDYSGLSAVFALVGLAAALFHVRPSEG